MSVLMLGLFGALVLIVLVLVASRRRHRRGAVAAGDVPLVLYSDQAHCDPDSADGGSCDGGGGD